MKIGIKTLYIDFHSHISPKFAVQNENMARGYKFRLVDSQGVLVEDESIKVYWNVSFNKKKLPDPVAAEYSNGEYTLKIPRIAVQEQGKGLAQFTVIKDSQILKSTPYEFNILQDVDMDGEDVIELENQGEKLKELIAQSEKALEEVAQGLEDMNTMQDESKELVEINKNLIEESKELIESSNLLLEEANNIKIDLQDEMDKANNLSNQLDSLILEGNSMMEKGEDILLQAQQAINEVNNAIEEGIDEEIQAIIEDKIAELSVSYNQLLDLPSINGVELKGDKSFEELGLDTSEFGKIDSVKVNGEALEIIDKAVDVKVPTKVSELDNDKEFTTQEEIETAWEVILDNIPSKNSDLENDTGYLTEVKLPLPVKDGDYIIPNFMMYNERSHVTGMKEAYFNGSLRANHIQLSDGANIQGRVVFEKDSGTSSLDIEHDYVTLGGRDVAKKLDEVGSVRDIKTNSLMEMWIGTQEEYDKIPSPSASVIYIIKE